MPYIDEESRKRYDDKILILVDALQNGNVNNEADPGHLNYVITELLVSSIGLDTQPKYRKLVTAIGTLVCVGLELYHRIGSEYEKVKAAEAGDISVYRRFTSWLHRTLSS